MMKSVLVIALLSVPTLSAAHGTSAEGIIRVESVVSGSPAEAAGIQTGDHFVTLDGREVATHAALKEVMEAHRPGDTVPLIVRRDGEMVDLKLTFGERPGGGVSIGVSLVLGMGHGDGAGGGEGTAGCLEWIDKTYRIDSMMRDLDLDLSDDYETIRACVGRDTSMMSEANAIRYCDNIFKVHCSGIDLVAEIGEAQVQQCEKQLRESLGLNPKKYKGWRTCAEQSVFERYSKAGEAIDEAACRDTFLDMCGMNIDATLEADKLSPGQREFVDCCSASTLDSRSRAGSDRCRMIDDGFKRGPCHDRPVCINRHSSEWIDCSVLD